MEDNPDFERLVIAAYRLPYKFIKTRSGYKTVQNSGGLVSAILALSEKINKKNQTLSFTLSNATFLSVFSSKRKIIGYEKN